MDRQAYKYTDIMKIGRQLKLAGRQAYKYKDIMEIGKQLKLAGRQASNTDF